MSRWSYFRASLSRQARGRSKDTIAIAVLAALGIVMTLWIFTQQKASLPSWVPVVGEEFDHLSGEFTTAQAVTPGQGQAVDVAGIQIGKVSSVDLEDGHAVVGMEIEPKYLELIHPDATLLLRPKTNLNDMVVEIDPGVAKGHVEDGHRFPLSRTEPNVNLDAFLATLDADTRQYIQLLVAGGAQGIGGRGRQFGNALRRLQPFSHYVADLNRAVARRRVALAHVIHDFGLLTTELGRHDTAIEGWVSSSKAALGNFANQQQSIQETLTEFPSALDAAESAFASADRFSKVARPALLGLIPQAQALRPALHANAKLFEQTLAPIRDQIPALHPRNAAGAHPRQGRLGRSRQVGARLRQLARRLQQLPQRARLQAEGLEAELPLLPALAQPRHQRHLQPRGSERRGRQGPDHDLLQRRRARQRRRGRQALHPDGPARLERPADKRNPRDPAGGSRG